MLVVVLANAQSSTVPDSSPKIDISAYVSPYQVEDMTDIARNNLENKLSQIITSSGLGVSSENSRFIITANIVVLSKDITPTAPPMQAYTLGVNLYIGDGMEGIKFSNCSVTLKGVGENETKAYMSALKNLKIEDPKYQDFIEKAKVKIVEYYNRKCDLIIKDAKLLASQNQFDAALFKLATIPDVCKACYDKSTLESKVIYKQYINYDGKTKLTQAKNIWAKLQNEDGAYSASQYLIEIDPNSTSYTEAKALTNSIGAKILADNNKEWSFKLKVYQDEIAANKATLQAERDIATAYAKSISVDYIVTGWW
ncbi:hypothetical protein CLU81_0521 [Flavobacterium sp. 9]|nr:hypothetical protein CLU81_0521 [Flavobacterium sp. 9]